MLSDVAEPLTLWKNLFHCPQTPIPVSIGGLENSNKKVRQTGTHPDFLKW